MNTIEAELKRFVIEREMPDGHYEKVPLWSLVEQAILDTPAEPVDAEQLARAIEQEGDLCWYDEATDKTTCRGWEAHLGVARRLRATLAALAPSEP
jgi:hypothetical protein